MYQFKSGFSLTDMVGSSPERQGESMAKINNSMPTPDSALENKAPMVEKQRGRTKGATAKGTTKQRAPTSSTTRVDNHRGGAAGKTAMSKGVTAATKKKRSALQESVNYRQIDDMGETDDLGLDEDQMGGITSHDELEPSILDSIEPKKKMAKQAPRLKPAQADPVKRVKAATKGKKRVVHEETPDVGFRFEDRIVVGEAQPREMKKHQQPQQQQQQYSTTGRPVKARAASTAMNGLAEQVIAETQASPGIIIDESIMPTAPPEEEEEEQDEENDVEEYTPVERPSSSMSKRAGIGNGGGTMVRRPSRAPSESRGRQGSVGVKRKRGEGLSSDGERGMTVTMMATDESSAALRRRLGDMTRRFEQLETRYRSLREVGVKEAETNFDRLKKQSQEKSEGKFSTILHTSSFALSVPVAFRVSLERINKSTSKCERWQPSRFFEKD